MNTNYKQNTLLKCSSLRNRSKIPYVVDIGADNTKSSIDHSNDFDNNFQTNSLEDKHLQQNSEFESTNHSKSKIYRNRCENCAELIKELENEKAKNGKTIQKDITNDFQLSLKDSENKYFTEKEQLQSTIKEINGKNTILQNNYNKCKKNYIQSKKDKENLQQKYSHLQIEYENLNVEYNDLMTEKNNLKLLIKDIENETTILQNNYDDSNLNFIQSEKDKENLQRKYLELQKMNENLKSDCDKLLKENKKLNSKIKEIDENNKTIKNNYDECNLKFDQIERDNENLEQKCTELRTEVECLTSVSSERLTELEYWKSKPNENLQNIHNEFLSQLECSQDKYKQLQSTLDALLIQNDKLKFRDVFIPLLIIGLVITFLMNL